MTDAASIRRQIDAGTAIRQAAAAARRAAEPLASGLVNISTRDTPLFDLDPKMGRIRRMRRRVCKAAQVHSDGGTAGLRPAMVTLTYADADGWQPGHIKAAIKHCRQWLARRGHKMRYVWTAELQTRGAIHYHVVAWFPPSDVPPFWDRAGWWPHGSTQSAWARNAVGYVVKYASKVDSKDCLPRGARMYGSGGFTPDQRKQMSFHSRPSWLRQLSQIGQMIKRAKGGGVVQHFACGLRRKLQSPFYVVSASPSRVIVARRDADPAALRQLLGDLWLNLSQPVSKPMPNLVPSC